MVLSIFQVELEEEDDPGRGSSPRMDDFRNGPEARRPAPQPVRRVRRAHSDLEPDERNGLVERQLLGLSAAPPQMPVVEARQSEFRNEAAPEEASRHRMQAAQSTGEHLGRFEPQRLRYVSPPDPLVETNPVED